MANPIDAKLRITAETAQAVAALKQVKAAKDELAKPAGSGAGNALTDLAADATEASTATKTATKDVQALAAERRKADAEAKAQRVAERQAAKDKKAADDDAIKQARQQANQARQLAPQLTDIAVGLSTGQSPFTVLLQQGGQLKDVFGGVGNAFKALGSIFTTTRVLVGGVAAAIATVAFEAYQGRQESDALRKSFALTGNTAGTSAGQIEEASQRIATQQKVSTAAARETLTALVATGDYTATSLDTAGRAATALGKITGQTGAEAIKAFDGMADGVTDWAAKNNRAYNFLTAEQFKYIQSLEAQGRTQEAIRFTLEQLAGTMEQRSIPALGSFERGWNGVKQAVSDVLDKLRAIGRDETPEQRIEKLRAQLVLLSRQSGVQPQRDAINQQIADVERVKNADQLRATERAAAQQAEQEQIKRESKSFQDALAQVDLAGSQLLLAQRVASLDAQQSVLDLSHARGLQSEVQYNVARAALDEQRLRAQEAALQRQVAIESGKKVEKPEDVVARDAAVKGLQAQLVQVRSQIGQAAAQGRQAVAADSLAQARQDAAEWAQIWQTAAQQVRSFAQQNAATRATTIADPSARAAAEAEAKTADAKRQVDELTRDLDTQIALLAGKSQQALQAAAQTKVKADRDALQANAAVLDVERQQLETKRQQLTTESGLAIAEQTRAAKFASYQQQIADAQQRLQLREAAIEEQVAEGAITTEEAEKRKLAARADAVPQLEQLLALLQAIAATDADKNAVESVVQAVTKVKSATTELGTAARGAGESGFAQLFSDIETGSKSAKGALLDLVGGFAKAMLDVLNKRLAQQLVDQFSQAASSSGFGGFISSLFGGGSTSTASGGGGIAGNDVGLAYHAGGVVGAGTGTPRAVSAAMFVAAPRYHDGGIAGLKPRERAAVLLDGEEVLTEDDPRHVNNLKRGNGAATAMVGDVSIAVSINGANGTDGDQRAAAQGLKDAIQGGIQAWAARESRVGGILAKRSS